MRDEETIEEFARREMVTIVGAIAGIFGFLAVVMFVLFYSAPVMSAEQYLAMHYNDNVRIVLSKEKCDQAGFRAVAQRIDKQYMRACWSLNEKTKMVNIKWEGGDFSEFPMSAFYPVEVK